jgi:prolyl-tRNA synthetase
MRISQTLLTTEKEAPQDAELISHKLMLRAGLIRKQASGIYSWLPMGLKVIRKIETIIREEMSKVHANEILMPSIIPSELWNETGRWDKYGSELLKVQDRNEREFCYGPTHEEVITDIARKEIRSYKQLPLNLYQIQTKFRDEIRPRFGVMRSREFIMKDAYSFHETNQCLNHTYNIMYDAYCNILNRIGLDFRAVQADSGAIGGNTSHEFQVLANAGEDTIYYSDQSDYAANIELATYNIPAITLRALPTQELQKTIGPHSIQQLADQSNISNKKVAKTIVIKDARNNYFSLVLRADHDINMIKVEKINQIISPCTLANDNEIYEIFSTDKNNIGPINSPIPIIVDHSANIMSDFMTGGNEKNLYYCGVNWDRDITLYSSADIRNVTEGDESPDGNGVLKKLKGIEVGHIFQLGDNYSQKMKAQILNQQGKSQPILMGCYGFGVSRIVAATIEQSHDSRGIIWPKSIAPYQVIISPINMHKSATVKSAAEKLYQLLISSNIETMFDDRKERPGAMFADADLIGIPHRIIISERGLKSDKSPSGIIEYKSRISPESLEIPMSDIIDYIKNS